MTLRFGTLFTTSWNVDMGTIICNAFPSRVTQSFLVMRAQLLQICPMLLQRRLSILDSVVLFLLGSASHLGLAACSFIFSTLSLPQQCDGEICA